MSYVDCCTRTFTAGAAVSAHALVKLSSGKVVHNTATATDDPVGIAEYAAAADGDDLAVRLINTDGTVEIVAAGAITSGAVVYAADAGKVQALPAAAATYRQIGIALEAAGADGDIIEILPYGFNLTKVVS